MPAPGRISRCIFSVSAPVPGAAPPARGRLEGRTSTRQNRRPPVHRGPSPGFLALRLAPVCFPVTIPGCDPGDQFRQFGPSPGRTQDDDALAVESQRYTISLPEAGLSGDRQRNPDGQAVPPFRDLGFILHMYLLGVYTRFRAHGTLAQ